MPITLEALKAHLNQSPTVQQIVAALDDTRVTYMRGSRWSGADLLALADFLDLGTLADLDARLAQAAPNAHDMFKTIAEEHSSSVAGNLEHWCMVLLVATERAQEAALREHLRWGKKYVSIVLDNGDTWP